MYKLIIALMLSASMLTSVSASATCGGSTAGGALVGGIVGGILGNQVGGGTGKDIATILGVVGGAALGSKQEQRQNDQDCKNLGEPVPPQVIYRPLSPAHHRIEPSTRILPGLGLYNNHFTCHKIEDTYWNGYQMLSTIRPESECTDGRRSFDVSNEYVMYHMSCSARTRDGQRLPSVNGSPVDKARLQATAMQRCEYRFGYGACIPSGCSSRN